MGNTSGMILLYIVLIVYILAVNFYSFLYVFALQKAEAEYSPTPKTTDKTTKDNYAQPTLSSNPTKAETKDKFEQLSISDIGSNSNPKHEKNSSKKPEKSEKTSILESFASKPIQGIDWKLFLCGALGGAITIYVCMFIFKYKLNNLLLMIVMPIFSAVNGYLWYMLLSSGFFIRA